VGNALFIATSLAVIVASASGGFAGAIVLYETALGVGIAIGPLPDRDRHPHHRPPPAQPGRTDPGRAGHRSRAGRPGTGRRRAGLRAHPGRERQP